MPIDINQRGKMVVDIATGNFCGEIETPKEKRARLGGIERAQRLNAKKRKEIAKKAAAVRWGKIL